MRSLHRSCVLFWILLAIMGRGTVAQFHLPRLISDQAFQEYATSYLALSEAQLASARHMLEDYKTSWAESFNKQSLELESKWNAVFTPLEKFAGADMGADFRDILALLDQARSQRKVANDLFFDSVEVILAEEQLPGMLRARNAHERLGYRFGKQEGALREREIDVISVVEGLEMSPEERAALAPVLAEYEPTYVTVLRDAAEIDLRREYLIFQCLELARQQSLHPDNDDGQQARRTFEGNRLSAEADRLGFGSQKRLVEANRRGLRLCIAALPAETATRLVETYNTRAYPEVIPDPVRADDLYEQALAIVKKNDADRTVAIEALRDAYDREHTSLTRKMIAAVFDLSTVPFELAIKFKGAEYGDDYTLAISTAIANAESQLRNDGLNRERLNLAQSAKLRALMLPEEIALLPVWRFDQAPPPRPWAKLANAETPETTKATRKYFNEQRRPATRPSSQPASAPVEP